MFEQTAEFKEEILECQRCKKNPIIVCLKIVKACEYCKTDLGKEYEFIFFSQIRLTVFTCLYNF